MPGKLLMSHQKATQKPITEMNVILCLKNKSGKHKAEPKKRGDERNLQSSEVQGAASVCRQAVKSSVWLWFRASTTISLGTDSKNK